MAFERTKEGQSNRARFLGVEIICYVEGGGGVSTDSDDGVFWHQVFRATRPDLRIKFLAKGGKPVLEELARSLIETNVANTIVAMDADYGRLEGKAIDDPRIFYTRGYSWENDILSQDYIVKIVSHTCNQVNGISAENEEVLRALHNDVCQKLKWAIKADYALLVAGSSLFPREKPGKVVSAEGPGFPPKVQQRFLVSLLKEKRRGLSGPRKRPSSLVGDPDISCVGHVYFFACMQIIKHCARSIKKSLKLTSDHIRDAGLIVLSNDIRSGAPSAIGVHYLNAGNRI